MKRKIITIFFLAIMILISVAFKTANTKGFQQMDGKYYRSYENKTYEILDTASFCLYFRYLNQEKPKGEGLIKKGVYYFSKDARSPIELLTLVNLKKAYPDNQSFRYSLDAQFRNDQELAAYDAYGKCYKIKYVYSQSLK
jgi:hypothetical protein